MRISRHVTCALYISISTLSLAAGCNADTSSSPSDVFGVEHLEPGDRCEHGGVLIRSGEDADGDGQPDGETSTHVVCNGAPGQDGQDGEAGQAGADGQDGQDGASGGATPLVDVSTTPPDNTCETGGTRVSVGLDTNANGTLEPEEITSSGLICNPSPVSSPQAPHVELRDVAPGDRCTAGGAALLIGTDTDGDGLLSDAEIEDSRVICNGEPGGASDTPHPLIDAQSTAPDATCPRGGVTLRLGNDDNNNGNLDPQEVQSEDALCRRYVVDLALHERRACAILSDGDVVCWGVALDARMMPGFNTTDTHLLATTLMQRVPSLHGARELAVGFDHLCARMGDGTVRCIGANDRGQLGDGTTHPTTATTSVMAPGGVRLEGVEALTAGYQHTCARIADGFVYCWGANDLGQLGDGSTADRPLATFVTGLNGVNTLAAGDGHTCALLQSGAVSCWGDNREGQLGDGTTDSSSSPVRVLNLSNAAQLDAGMDFNCVIRSDSSAACWGNNAEGQLGAAVFSARETAPVPIICPSCESGLLAPDQLALGFKNVCMLPNAPPDRTRAPSCWGYNNAGLLGLSDPSFYARPPGHTSSNRGHFTRVRVATFSACALDLQGNAWCWGSNTFGQRGIPNTTVGAATTYPEPTLVHWTSNL